MGGSEKEVMDGWRVLWGYRRREETITKKEGCLGGRLEGRM